MPETTPACEPSDRLRIKGARTHNLQHISLDLPLKQWVAVVGVSGAGKSSLVRETLLVEGERRYLEGCSVALRKQFDQVERPDVDQVLSLPFPVLMDRERLPGHVRMTVGRFLAVDRQFSEVFSRIGIVHCPKCDTRIQKSTPEQVSQALVADYAESRAMVLFEVASTGDAATRQRLEQLHTAGYSRWIVNERSCRWEEAISQWTAGDRIWCVVDRAQIQETAQLRIQEAVASAFREGRGTCRILVPAADYDKNRFVVDGQEWNALAFSERWQCLNCNVEFPEPRPELFRWETRYGGCQTCHGAGTLRVTSRRKNSARKVNSSDEGTSEACANCRGTRFRSESRSVRVADLNIAEVYHLPIGLVQRWIEDVQRSLSPTEIVQCGPLLQPLFRACEILEQFGLNRISLDRLTSRLSTGEQQRLMFAQFAIAKLVQTLLIVEEPTRGLDAPARRKALSWLRQVQQGDGNSLIVVENDAEFVRAADWVLELGPGGGGDGGRVVFNGPVHEFLQTDGFQALSSGSAIQPPTERSFTGELRVILRSDSEHLHRIPVPMGGMVLLEGKSGCGKSRLMEQLAAMAPGNKLEPKWPAGEIQIENWNGVDEVVWMGASALRVTPLSFPASLSGAWGEIRRLFAETEESRRRNFSPSTFSLTSAVGGRCPVCAGRGEQVIPMHFLPDVTTICPECQGNRYRPEVLDVQYRGLTIAEVLRLTIRESLVQFRGHGTILRRLTAMNRLGMEYLPLGQPGNTLSEGERQRIKLAEHLARRSGVRTLFLLDDPSAGLHPHDLEKLFAALSDLIGAGHSVWIADHHPAWRGIVDAIVTLPTDVSGGESA